MEFNIDDLPILPEEIQSNEKMIPYLSETLENDKLFCFQVLPHESIKLSHHFAKSFISSDSDSPNSHNEKYDFQEINELFKIPISELKQKIKLILQKRVRLASEPDSACGIDSEGGIKKPKSVIISLGLRTNSFTYMRHTGAICRNYIRHCLNDREIYMEYVSEMKSKEFIENSKTILRQFQNLKSTGTSFLKNCITHLKHKTLILDLDETLIHTTSTDDIKNCDARFAYSDPHQNKYIVYLKLRPFLFEFLNEMSKKYEIIIYTATHPLYADRILNFIEHKQKYFAYRLYRNHCIAVNEGKVYKSIDFLMTNRDPKEVVFVDNCVKSLTMNLKNSVPIKSYYGEQSDCELFYLANYLNELYKEEDVREKITSDYANYIIEHAYSN